MAAPIRFDLSQPSYDLFRHKPLHESTVQQSFTFDGENRRLFVAQRRDGSDSSVGDLCITQLDFEGNQVGWMHLEGFGHGVAFGAEAVGGATYLWTEVDANASGYGSKLARFEFRDGATLTSESSELDKHAPVADATEHTCAVDPISQVLFVRYHLDGAKRIRSFPLDAAAGGDFSSWLADIAQPSLGDAVFQGYAGCDRYLYLFDGESYDASPTLDSRVTCVDVDSGEIV